MLYNYCLNLSCSQFNDNEYGGTLPLNATSVLARQAFRWIQGRLSFNSGPEMTMKMGLSEMTALYREKGVMR
jgi:hypothetical protein